jgi:hypothetical protein
MKQWFTTHWPAPEDEKVLGTFDGVWVPDGKLHVIQDITPDDLVWVYEAATGPTEIRADLGGQRVRRKRGRMGVIGLVEVIGYPIEPAGSRKEEYVGRPGVWWRYFAPARPVNTGGFIPMDQAAALLGHQSTYNFRGYGGGSGLKQIDASTHERLHSAYVGSSRSDLSARLQRPFAGGGRAPGGEQAPHRELKERIAADPAVVLGEPGLRLVSMEMQFPTGDRIDVVLEDRHGGLVAVEVEVHCSAEEVCGPLQCMKYRSLLAYRFDRDPREVRMLLAAHSVHPEVQKKCERYEIGVVELA